MEYWRMNILLLTALSVTICNTGDGNMLTYLKIKNFKNLTDLFFDLTDNHQQPKHTAIVYGENGSGKTNLVSSILFLLKSLDTLSSQFIIKKELQNRAEELKANGSEIDKINIDEFMKRRYFSLEDLVSENQSLATSKGIDIEIGFELNGSKGSYHIVCNDSEIVGEELRFLISKRSGIHFSITHDKVYISSSVFTGEYLKNLHSLTNQYWGKHSFLSIMNYEKNLKNQQYIKDNISENLRVFMDWINTISIYCHTGYGSQARLAVPYQSLFNLRRGKLSSSINLHEKDSIENALDLFFGNLYSDVQRVYYKAEETSKGSEYELFLRKEVRGRVIEIPFKEESTSTQKLLELFPFFYSTYSGRTVIIDELDNGIHDLLISRIIDEITEMQKGQLIATTHATTVMNSVKPENLYVISSNPFGDSEIQCLSDYSFRTQKNHNIRNKYLNGDYQGVPIIGHFDLNDIFSTVDKIDNDALSED